MLRTDHSIFMRRLFSHILHNTAFQGVGLMNQIWFFVDNCLEMLHPDPSLHCAASCLHFTYEEDSTILSCIENTSAPISASDLRCSQERCGSNSACFLSYMFDFCPSILRVVAWTASRLQMDWLSLLSQILAHTTQLAYISYLINLLANLLNFGEISKFQIFEMTVPEVRTDSTVLILQPDVTHVTTVEDVSDV